MGVTIRQLSGSLYIQYVLSVECVSARCARTARTLNPLDIQMEFHQRTTNGPDRRRHVKCIAF